MFSHDASHPGNRQLCIAKTLSLFVNGLVSHAHLTPGWHAGGLLDYEAVNDVLDSDQIGALGLDVQWQEPWDPEDSITKHPK